MYDASENNKEAVELNNIIKKKSQTVFSLLSKKGRAIYFPKKGILNQGAQAKGKAINATIGMACNEDGSTMCLDYMAKMVNLPSEKIFNYSPSYGYDALRSEWRNQIYSKNPSLKTEISMPVVSIGLTHALSLCAYLFFDEDDELIVSTPFWGNYNLVFSNEHLNKVVATDFFKFDENEGYSINLDSISEKLNSKGDKKGILLNFPNNPSGYTPTYEEINKIVNIIKKAAKSGKKIVSLIDDAYFGLVYKSGVYKESIFSLLSNLHENVLAVKIDGATKEDYSWGLRVGFVTFGIKGGDTELYSALEDKIAGILRGNISNISTLSQYILLAGLKSKDYIKEKSEKFNILKSRFEKVDKILDSHREYKKYFVPIPHNSGYFMCIKLLSGNAEELRLKLLNEYSTGVIAIGDDIIRIAYSSTPISDLEILFSNIYKAQKEIS